MATKGQKFVKYTDDMKKIVMEDIKKGKSINYLSFLINSMKNIINNYFYDTIMLVVL